MMVVRIGKMVYARYWLYELYEVFPKFEDILHCGRGISPFEELCEGATADIFTQNIASVALNPRTIEAGHMLHCISATRVTQ